MFRFFILKLVLMLGICFSSVEAFAKDKVNLITYVSKHTGVRDKLHKDKERKVILAIPDNVKPDNPTLIVWFHGLTGFTEKTFKRVLTQVRKAASDNHSVAVVIPEMPWSKNTRTPRGRQGKVWKSKNEFKDFLKESKTYLSKFLIEKSNLPVGPIDVIVVGHSAGGSAIMSASLEGSLCHSSVKKVIWSDASYGRWLMKANKGCLGKSDIYQAIVVRKWDKPHREAEKFFRETSSCPACDYIVLPRRQYTHGRIGDKILTITNLFPPGC